MFSLTKAESGVVWHPSTTYSTGLCFLTSKRCMLRRLFSRIFPLLAVSAIAVVTTHAQSPQPPSVQITNGTITATVYLPDATAGFYRGTRFDWAGVIGRLEYRGHTFYQPWFTKTDATVRDFTNDGVDVTDGSTDCSDRSRGGIFSAGF